MIYDAYEAARSTSSNCDGALADRVPKRQPDLATSMMLEQASFPSNGDYFQLSWIALIKQSSYSPPVSIRVRFMHSEDNQTQSLRDVDPVAYDDVRAILATDVTTVVTTEHGSWHKKTTAFNDTGRTTKKDKLKIPMGIIFNAVSLSWSRAALSDDLLSSVQPLRTRSLFIFLLFIGRSW